MEPPHSFVRETSTCAVHHRDYLNRDDDHALCGVAFENPTPLDEPADDVAICPDCAARLAEYHARWWRHRALAAEAELEELRTKYLSDEAHRPAPAADAPATDVPTADDEKEPASLLDHARRELLALCRQCDEAIPYWRLKTAMQKFSDTLSTDQRVLLAQEIGADGSLIRWCTTEIVNLGRQVTNSPVQEESEAMWDAWTHDAYQTPKKTKWRLGRSRSQDAS
ncbi:hypothetical protein DQP55_09405 [Mycolicibacterium sp. GF69]|uniref:hypothetical protein n=1 Tax=Mycolicibacterium sp. GF69 TaxID=2267251 RepID=UPI000DCB090C|nr:hypothetical protein [Mycolicibacterium sp. GF69]RAV13942.1 hypothetical protein DQP55_09405 [Mycolicibacterium sp. GF69]